jgi:hypothetical protein
LHLGILNPAFFGTTHTCLLAVAIVHVSSCDVMGFEGLRSEVQSCRLDPGFYRGQLYWALGDCQNWYSII